MGSRKRGQGLRCLPPLETTSAACPEVQRVRPARLDRRCLDAVLPNCRFQLQPIPMPELPDVSAYISALEPRIIGQPLERVRLQSAFSCEPRNRRLRTWKVASFANCEDSASALQSA